jgi:uncharacterized membrane protein
MTSLTPLKGKIKGKKHYIIKFFMRNKNLLRPGDSSSGSRSRYSTVVLYRNLKHDGKGQAICVPSTPIPISGETTMSLAFWLMIFCVSFMVYLLLDLIWLRYVAGSFYQEQLDFLLAPEPRMTPALLFYVLFVLGNLVFVTKPVLTTPSLNEFLFRGCLYGLVTYGTYDLTNYSTVEGWPVVVTALDLTWGVGISLLVSGAGYYTGVYLPYIT